MPFLTALLLISAQPASATMPCPVAALPKPERSIKGVEQPFATREGRDAETLEDTKRRAPSRIADARRLALPRGVVRDQPARSRRIREIGSVDFPAFVSDLIDGVFDEIVDNSIKQMDSYSDLVAGASQSVDQFRNDNVSDATGRDMLVDPRCPRKKSR